MASENRDSRTSLAPPSVVPEPTRPVPEPQAPPRVSLGGHVPALDGVRGVAILLVVLHHTLYAWRPGGTGVEALVRSFVGHAWTGVDLFFVLSGFLITGILFDTKGKRRYFGSFYPRRMLRTFPLYYATLLVCFVLLPALLPASTGWLRELAAHQGWFWAHLSNFYTLFHNVVRMDGPDIGWMSTFWSLAVEEQFYLVWPLVVFFCTPRRLVVLCGALLAGVLLLRIAFAVQGYPFIYIYHHTLTRLDGVVLGSMIAALSRCPGGLAAIVTPARILTAAAIAGLALLVALRSRFEEAYVFCSKTIVYTAVAVVFAGLLVHVLRSAPGSPLRRVFSHPFLQACGKFSFAMYILNIPVIRLLELAFRPDEVLLFGSRLPAIAAFAAAAALLSLGGAWITWHLLEKHCLKLKRFFEAA
jgi:peptidoglycan/LPS O-acetylase OafA/YrhL